MEQIRQRELIARQIPLLRQNALVARELGQERAERLLHACLVRRPTAARPPDALHDDRECVRREVRGLDRRGLLEQRARAQVRRGRDEARVRRLLGDAAPNRARLEKDEPIVVLGRACQWFACSRY